MTAAKHIVIAVCSGDMVHADFAMSLAMVLLVTDQARVPVDISNVRTSIIPHSRTMAVEEAKAAGATHVLFLDSDMTFPGNAALRLLAHDKPIVGATYRQRSPPHILNHRELDGAFGEVSADEVDLRPVESIGTGCLLIEMQVFTKIPIPYFRFGYEKGKPQMVGEDTLFCRDAREAGYKIWMDPGLSRDIEHIGLGKFKV